MSGVDRRPLLAELLQDHHADVLEAAEAQPLASTNPAAASATNSHDTKQSTGIYYADKALLGLGLYAISSVFLATMLICAKTLSKRGFPTWQNLLCRSLSIMVVALVICAKQRVNPFGNRRGLLAIRGVFGFGAIGCYFFAVTKLPLNDTMVLTFLAPLVVALASPVVIKENPPKAVYIAIPVCVVGVIFITQPSWLGGGTHPRSALGIILAIGQAIFSACAKMCVRELRKTDTANVSVFYLSLCSTIGATVGLAATYIWGDGRGLVMPHSFEWLLFLGIGVAGYGTQICMTYALKYSKAAPALAMSYLSVVWGLLGGFFFFHEVPNWLSICGAVLICSCTFLLGVFTRTAKPDATTVQVQPEDPADAERAEVESLLGHKVNETQGASSLNGHRESV